MKQALSGKEIWTYPMRVAGDPTPKWFLVHIAPGGLLSETTIIDESSRNPGIFAGGGGVGIGIGF